MANSRWNEFGERLRIARMEAAEDGKAADLSVKVQSVVSFVAFAERHSLSMVVMSSAGASFMGVRVDESRFMPPGRAALLDGPYVLSIVLFN